MQVFDIFIVSVKNALRYSKQSLFVIVTAAFWKINISWTLWKIKTEIIFNYSPERPLYYVSFFKEYTIFHLFWNISITDFC